MAQFNKKLPAWPDQANIGSNYQSIHEKVLMRIEWNDDNQPLDRRAGIPPISLRGPLKRLLVLIK